MQLKEYLEKTGLKNSFFADKIGVSHQLLLRYLKGYNRPPLEILVRIEDETNGKVPVREWLSAQNCENNAGEKAKSA